MRMGPPPFEPSSSELLPRGRVNGLRRGRGGGGRPPRRAGAVHQSLQQADGLTLSPRVEVEFMDVALRLAVEGLGDTHLPSAYTHASDFPDGLTTAPFTPALYDTFALITRRAARLSPGVRELVADLEAHMQAVASEFDRSR
jgi:DNA-binding transcriptional LysR family regulator